MNRKTNVFYLSGNDSKFLTFDNYTDALTGDIIATNQKLWPSRFLCVNIKYFNEMPDSIETNEEKQIVFNKKKKDFIKNYLVKYYENKLAFLRDKVEDDEETKLLPLIYLLEIICYYGAINSGKSFETIQDLETDLYNKYRTFNTNKSKELMDYIRDNYNIDFCYIGDIIEQDYNGTYADIICTITPSNRKLPLFSLNPENKNGDIIMTDKVDQDGNYTEVEFKYDFKNYESENKLFGWNSQADEIFIKKYFNEISDEYLDKLTNRYIYNNTNIDVSIVDLVDKINKYLEPEEQLQLDDNSNIEEIKEFVNNINNYINQIKIDDILFDHINDNDEVSIPVYNIDSILNKIIPEENNDKLSFNVIIPLFDSEYLNGEDIDESLNEIEISRSKSVPLGIYFCDKEITLDNDVNGYSSNWSLLISTQFKSFPYSYDITHNFDDSDSIKDAYVTFAEILSKQTNFIDLLNKYNDTVMGLANRIATLESAINSVSSVQNIDELNQNLISLKNHMNESFEDFQNQLDNLKESIEANKLKWKIKNNE